MAKKLTAIDVLEAYRAAKGMGKREFAAWLEMSRSAYYNILAGSQMKVEDLQWAARQYVGKEYGNLAVDLLKARGAEVPCVCETALWDNGICPKHGKHPLMPAEVNEVEEESEAVLCDGGGKA